MNKVPALNFMGSILANVDNEKLSDTEFREFIRNTLPVVEKPKLDENMADQNLKAKMEKYY